MLCKDRPICKHAKPRAFVALSLAGKGDTGWDDESYGDVERPILLVTGTADTKDKEPGKDALARAAVYDDLKNADPRYRLFVDSPVATHGFFGFGKNSDMRMRPVVQAAVVSFLDAHLRGDADARAYLESDATVAAGPST